MAADARESDRSIPYRWGQKLYKVSQQRNHKSKLGGFVPVLRSFIRLYHKLPMTPTEAMLVIHILDGKWSDRPTFVSSAVLATRTGLSVQQVKRYLAKFRSIGIESTYVAKKRHFLFTDFTGFQDRLAALSDEKIKQDEAKEGEDE